jgi:hypothetical protein
LNFLTSLPKPGRTWPLLILHNLRQDGINPSLPSRFWFIGDRAHAQAQAMPLMTMVAVTTLRRDIDRACVCHARENLANPTWEHATERVCGNESELIKD